ncbi:MAG: site-2 protease family protein, partial [Candidatus Sumerlaeia bacterium]|nr:site-2 protease family protein [Candidatus Sumerlaeia bacterium]
MSLNLIGLIGIAFTFGVAIFVHEFGHFLLAKLMKVPVATFSFGFGEKIFKYKWGETVYAIGII